MICPLLIWAYRRKTNLPFFPNLQRILLATTHNYISAHCVCPAGRSLISALQLVFGAVHGGAYRGRLAIDQPVEGMLETRATAAACHFPRAVAVASPADHLDEREGICAARLTVSTAIPKVERDEDARPVHPRRRCPTGAHR
jgi:hypothetical protein